MQVVARLRVESQIEQLGDHTPTGRRISGPSADIVEVDSPSGDRRVALVFNDRFRDHTVLTTDVDMVRSFMEFPMVPGVSDLAWHEPGSGVFIYDTGEVWSLFEVIRAIRDSRRSVSYVRAGLELCYAAALMLQEASENGPMQGIYSHGGLTPWRLALDPWGGVQVLGYGLHQIELTIYREDKTKIALREDSVRYCPPERLTSGHEDVLTDLYSVVLIAWELITGKPLLEGRTEELLKAVEFGDAQQKMMEQKGIVPADIHTAFVHSLAFDPGGRFADGHEFAAAMAGVLDGNEAQGPGLAALLEQILPTLRRGKRITTAGSRKGPSATAPSRASRKKTPRTAQTEQTAAPKAESRWGKVEDGEGATARRSRRTESAQAPATAGRTRRRGAGSEDGEKPTRGRATTRAASESPTPRRRRRKADAPAEGAVEAVPAAEATPAADAPKPRRRSSRAKKADAAAEPAATPAADAPKPRRSRAAAAPAEEAAPAPRRRSRTKAASSDDDAPAPRRRTSRAKKTNETPEADAPRPRRRSRGSDDASSEPAPRRRSRAKPAADGEEAPRPRRRSRAAASEDGEAPKPRRRSRAKKD
jgi:hypothetical protein